MRASPREPFKLDHLGPPGWTPQTMQDAGWKDDPLALAAMGGMLSIIEDQKRCRVGPTG